MLTFCPAVLSPFPPSRNLSLYRQSTFHLSRPPLLPPGTARYIPLASDAYDNKPAASIPGGGVGTPPLAPEEAQQQVDMVPDRYAGYLDAANIVSVPLPLDLYLEETASGSVFVDEVVAGGNAENAACVEVGDVIIAVSLPFGEALHPVPKEGGLAMVEDHINARENALEFRMALVSGDIGALREEIDDGAPPMTLEEMESNAKHIYIDEYPTAPPREVMDEEKGLDVELLRDAGFDI